MQSAVQPDGKISTRKASSNTGGQTDGKICNFVQQQNRKYPDFGGDNSGGAANAFALAPGAAGNVNVHVASAYVRVASGLSGRVEIGHGVGGDERHQYFLSNGG